MNVEPAGETAKKPVIVEFLEESVAKEFQRFLESQRRNHEYWKAQRSEMLEWPAEVEEVRDKHDGRAEADDWIGE